MERKSIVLVDTNAIIEAHRIGIWIPLAEHFSLHTVETVVIETQTGAQNRNAAENIDDGSLRASLEKIYEVSESERAQVIAKAGNVMLDPGELDLLAYAHYLGEAQVWLLNSPDRAAVRYCHERKWQDRVVSLEAMLTAIRQKRDLRLNYTEEWLSRLKLDLYFGRL